MKLFAKLKQTVAALAEWEGRWAICGGVAASLYREIPRFTGDIDIALIDSPIKSAQQFAEEILPRLGYSPKLGLIADASGELLPGVSMIIGREDRPGSFQGLDFILPAMPWVEPAVIRAQGNKLDYGFGYLPTIIAEDLVLAKLYALNNSPERATDLDDIISILEHEKGLDVQAIGKLAAASGIVVHERLKKYFKS